MSTFTVSIPAELKKEIDQFPSINWAEYIKERLELRLKELEKFQKSKEKWSQ